MLEWSPLGSLEPDNSDTFVSSPHNVTRLSHYRVLPAIAPDGNFIENRGFNQDSANRATHTVAQ
jgi:hypothetical protein